jgi:hypothetical protein
MCRSLSMFCDVVYNSVPSRIFLKLYKHMHIHAFTLYIHAYVSTHTQVCTDLSVYIYAQT